MLRGGCSCFGDGNVMKTVFGIILLVFCAMLGDAIGAEDQSATHPEEREGAATIIHRSTVIRDRSTNSSSVMRLWPLYATAEARMNYVEVAGKSAMHFHPDADHKLYVLEGRVAVTAGTNTNIAIAGDLIIIPK